MHKCLLNVILFTLIIFPRKPLLCACANCAGVCGRARYHFIVTHLYSLRPPSLSSSSFSFVCQRLRAFRYSINNNSVNLFFPPQRLSRCVHFSCATKSVCFAAVVVAAAATMMVYVWPINNTRINIEWRLKLDWTQCRVASEKEHKHTNTHTPRKRVFTHKQKQWQ